MVSHMVFLTKLGFENLKNLVPVTPSPFCKVGRMTELPDGRVTLSPWETNLDDDFGLKRPNHHLGPKYVHLFRAKNVWYMGRLFWEFQVLCKNPDEVGRFWQFCSSNLWIHANCIPFYISLRLVIIWESISCCCPPLGRPPARSRRTWRS